MTANDICPTCHGSGIVWRSSYNGANAAFACPTCPDDGTGNSCGTGRIAPAAPEPTRP